MKPLEKNCLLFVKFIYVLDFSLIRIIYKNTKKNYARIEINRTLDRNQETSHTYYKK